MDVFYERKEQYRVVYRSSFLFLISSSYALLYFQYHFALLNMCIFLTSINYWRKPMYSWRRTLDMTVVNSAIIYKNIVVYNSLAYNPTNVNLYYFIFFSGSLAYPLSIYCYNYKFYWTAVYLHMLLHVMANIASIILYTGYEEKYLNICVE